MKSHRYRRHLTSRSRCFLPSNSPGGFSLIELLLVISIMTILTATIMPSALSSLRDSNLSVAGGSINDLATWAHQNSINHNALTAMILVTNDAAQPALNGRALTVLQYQADGTWQQCHAWVILPPGTRAYDDPVAATDLPQIAGASAPTLSLQGSPLPATSYTAFVFSADGSIYQQTSSTRTAYVQFAQDPAPSTSGNSSLRNYYDLIFNSDTGGAHVVRP